MLSGKAPWEGQSLNLLWATGSSFSALRILPQVEEPLALQGAHEENFKDNLVFHKFSAGPAGLFLLPLYLRLLYQAFKTQARALLHPADLAGTMHVPVIKEQKVGRGDLIV